MVTSHTYTRSSTRSRPMGARDETDLPKNRRVGSARYSRFLRRDDSSQIRLCRSTSSFHLTVWRMDNASEQHPQQIEAAPVAMVQGDPSDAERLLIEAIDTGERELGVEHPSLAVPLNELSRLYI